MKRSAIYLLLGIGIFSIGCNKNPANANAGFSDKLTLGTGMSGFTLTNEGTTFTLTGGSVTIYFRLESAVDMAGSAVTIKVEQEESGIWANNQSFIFSNPQSSGHILLSSFSLTSVGSYRATGILATGNVTVATKTFAVQ